MTHDDLDGSLEDTHFHSGPGVRLGVRIYHPPGLDGVPAPSVLFCHGFGGKKEGTPVGMSKLLSAAGYRVMTFDFRGFGDAEGPVGRLVPSERVEDAMTALEYLAAREDVDEDRVAIYGTSFGGATALRALRRSKVPRCAVVTVPVTSGSRWLRSLARPYEFETLVRRAREALVEKTRTGEMVMVERYDIMIQDPEKEHVKTMEPVPMAIETVLHVISDEPIDDAPWIDRPTLVIAVRNDDETPIEQATLLYERLQTTKRLVIFQEGNHLSVYNELLQGTFEETKRWLETHLQPRQDGKTTRDD